MNKYKIIAITETWLKANLPDSLICTNDKYQIFRCDRSKKGGGAAIIISNILYVSQIIGPKFNLIDYLILEVFDNNLKHKLRLLNIYIPPSAKLLEIENFCIFLTNILTEKCPIICIGDFNMPNILWDNSSQTNISLIEKHFYNFTKQTGLKQLITTPTRKNNNEQSKHN